MCLLCTEVAKEIIKPKDFWRNYRELSNKDDHWKEVLAAVLETSPEYQTALSLESLKES